MDGYFFLTCCNLKEHEQYKVQISQLIACHFEMFCSFAHAGPGYSRVCGVIFAACIADWELTKSVTVTSPSTVNHPVAEDDGFPGSCTEAQMLVKPVM